VILYFLENGQQVTARQAQLIRDGLLNPFRANGSLTTTAKENLTYDSGTITKKPVSASELVTRKHGGLGTNQVDNPVLNKTKTATPAGLVTINQSGVGTYQSNGNIVDDSEHTPIGEITRKTTASGIVTRAKNGLGATQMSNNPVLNITQIASPSRLMRSRHSGVV